MSELYTQVIENVQVVEHRVEDFSTQIPFLNYIKRE